MVYLILLSVLLAACKILTTEFKVVAVITTIVKLNFSEKSMGQILIKSIEIF